MPSSGTGSCGPTTLAGWCGFEYRNEERDDVREAFAIHTPVELRAVIDRIEAMGRGKPIGEQMQADAHGWDADV